MKLEYGKPLNLSDRLPREQRVYDFLEKLGIVYARVDHESAMTMEACLAVDAVLGAPMCKNLLLCNRQQTDFYLLLLPGDKVFKTSILSKEIGTSRLSFASGEAMEQLLDITPGSLSVLGLMNDRENKVQLLIDEALMEGEYFCCHPCINTSSLRIAKDDMMARIIPAMGHAPRFVTLSRE